MKTTKKITRTRTVKKIPSTLNLLLKSLAETYSRDKTSPGIVGAWLADKQKFYVSICRYDQAMGQGKQVVTSYLADSFDAAVEGAAKNWINGTQNIRHLRRRLSTADIWHGETSEDL